MLHIATPDGITPKDNDFDLIPEKVRKIEVKVEAAENYVPQLFALNPEIKVNIK